MGVDRHMAQCEPHMATNREAERVPSAVYRETPPQGLLIDNTFVPGHTKILAPRFSISRLESCFENADQFVPERWYSRPEMVRAKIAHSPFGFGRWSCVGKNVALEEIRYVVSRLVSKYTVKFAPGETGLAVLRDTKDQVIAVPGPLRLSFAKRV